jgi:hypothetical protein
LPPSSGKKNKSRGKDQDNRRIRLCSEPLRDDATTKERGKNLRREKYVLEGNSLGKYVHNIKENDLMRLRKGKCKKVITADMKQEATCL